MIVIENEDNESRTKGEESLARHSSPVTRRSQPIGVFDSGVGGLTVLRALRERLPSEDFVYLGDTARLPYGTKSAHSVTRYSLQAAELLVRQGIKYLVVACNTASSVALDALRKRFAPLPVMGVIEPGAEAACAATRSQHIAVIATEGTIRDKAYQRAIARRAPEAIVIGQACSLFVAMAEEGWTNGPIVEAVARRYLAAIFEGHPAVDTLLLGCTHFPVLANALRAVLADHVNLVDSARTTAVALDRDLQERELLGRAARSGAMRLFATDNAERFTTVGSLFLGENFAVEDVEIVDLTESERLDHLTRG